MGIKYGFCSAVKGRRINLGKTSLVCGCNAFVYATDLGGSVSQTDVGIVSPRDVGEDACGSTMGGCGSGGGIFFIDSASYNVSCQNNPINIGCCSDHLTDQGKLINTTVGGMTASKEHTLSAQGKGEPWSIGVSPILTIITSALMNGGLVNLDVPPPPEDGAWVPTSMDSSLAIDDWQSGSASWSLFEGYFTEMISEPGVLHASGYDDSVSVNIQTGRVDVTRSLQCYSSRAESSACDPVDAMSAVCTFVNRLNSIDLSTLLASSCN